MVEQGDKTPCPFIIKMKNKTIHYKDLVNRNKQIDSLKRNGFIIIPKRKFKTIGYIFIGVGVLTIPIPFITIPLFAIGLLLIGLSKQELYDRVRKKIKLMLYKIK